MRIWTRTWQAIRSTIPKSRANPEKTAIYVLLALKNKNMRVGVFNIRKTEEHRRFSFAGFTLDLDRAALLRDGVDLNLRPQVFDVLRNLVERGGCLVSKDELQAAIWGDRAVTDDSLTHCIIEIRKALGDAERRIIRTIPRRGFVLDVPVEILGSGMDARERKSSPSSVAQLTGIAITLVAAVYFLSSAFTGADAFKTEIAKTVLPDYYEQARFLFHRRGPGDLEAARDYFLKLIDQEPESSRAWAGLAGVYRIQSNQNLNRREELLGQLKLAAETSIGNNPGNAEAWVRLSNYYYETDDSPAAQRALNTAIEADPDDPLVLASMAGQFAFAGDLDSAIEYQRRAASLEPLSFISRGNLSSFLFAAGQFEEAINESLRAHQMRPATSDDPNTLVGFALVKLGSFEKALDVVEEWPAGADKFAALAMAGYALGRDEEAAQAVAALLKQTGGDSTLRMAEIEAYCKNLDAAFRRLTQMRQELIASANPNEIEDWIFRLRLSPFLAGVRDDSRWQNWVQQTRDLVVAANLPAALN